LKKFSLLGSINALDAKEESVGLSSEDVDRRRREREELGRVLQLEEVSWRQKSRALWLKEGDRNTRFFHRTANSRRRFNFMASVVVDGICCETIENLKTFVHGFFRELFTENEPWRPKVDGLLLPSLSIVAREILERQFDKEEITKALFDCCGDKAPGPDGMTMAFLQANWDVVRGDVLKMFSEFHLNGKFVASLNVYFYWAYPKESGCTEYKRLLSN